MTSARQALGGRAENLACEYLERQGLVLILRNYRRRLGELDLVMRHGDTLVIAEVRTRGREDFGGAAASIDAFKQRRIVRAAQQLLQQRRDLARMPARFDVVVVHDAATQNAQIEWIRHAFER